MYRLVDSTGGAERIIAAPISVAALRPAQFRLSRVSPDPSTALLTVQFDAARAARVELALFDLAGRKISSMRPGDVAAGPHSIDWNWEDHSLPAGIYGVRFRHPSGSSSRWIAHTR